MNRRHAERDYVNGYARAEKFQGPLVTKAFDEERGVMVHTCNRSRTGNTDYLDKSLHGWGRTRIWFHENQATRQLAQTIEINE